ncbi:MAG: deoxyguanosinetriphosphate triphosphohydrolase, partial [Burkholderiales bacterium]|nr:deoxyguanosinetriphosphate triphosphohydrolase [Burkholderiales bacterium]
SLEEQIANLDDDIAYKNPDVDDGLRSGLLTMEDLSQVAIFARHLDMVRREYPDLHDRRVIHETVRRMINTLVSDLTRQSRAAIEAHRPAGVDEVRALPPLIAFSPSIREEAQALKTFLRRRLYQHYRVARMAAKSRRIVQELFAAFLADGRLLPPEFQRRGEGDLPRAIADYIAGMTDRYAIREHRRLFAVEES